MFTKIKIGEIYKSHDGKLKVEIVKFDTADMFGRKEDTLEFGKPELKSCFTVKCLNKISDLDKGSEVNFFDEDKFILKYKLQK